MNNNDGIDDPSVYGHNGDEIHHQIGTGFYFFFPGENKETGPVYMCCALCWWDLLETQSCISTLYVKVTAGCTNSLRESDDG